jgi:hypothetical protein
VKFCGEGFVSRSAARELHGVETRGRERRSSPREGLEISRYIVTVRKKNT